MMPLYYFVYVSLDSDPTSHRGVVETESTKCTVVALRDACFFG